MKKVFHQGPISPQFIADSIAKHQTKTSIGAHQIFLGQVRADEINDKQVIAIDYTAHEEMAEMVFHEIRESTFAEFPITCMHIHHSLGEVKAGEICLFIFVSSAHRETSNKAIVHLVEEIKAKVPVFGKEMFEDGTHVWKENK